jgi:hypothetical protein
VVFCLSAAAALAVATVTLNESPSRRLFKGCPLALTPNPIDVGTVAVQTHDELDELYELEDVELLLLLLLVLLALPRLLLLRLPALVDDSPSGGCGGSSPGHGKSFLTSLFGDAAHAQVSRSTRQCFMFLSTARPKLLHSSHHSHFAYDLAHEKLPSTSPNPPVIGTIILHIIAYSLCGYATLAQLQFSSPFLSGPPGTYGGCPTQLPHISVCATHLHV